jgi:VCBS repeat-containing protein
VLANDSDPDSDNLAVSAVDGLSGDVGALLVGTYGDLIVNGDGNYSYSADNAAAIASGPTGSHLHDIFSYAASDGLGGTANASLDITLDRLPVTSPDLAGVQIGKTVSGNVLANDSDPDGDPLQLVGVTGGSLGQGVVGRFGTLVINGDGNFTYASNKSAPLPSLGVAQDLFTYSESDGHGAIVQGTLTITVIPNGTNYIAGTPGETIDAGNGKGIIDASLGSQTVVGGNGADTLIGGPHDVLTGGNGPDTFEFGPSSGPNTITDFDVHNDTIVFDRSLFAGFADIQAHTKQVGADTVITYHGTDTLILQHVTATSLRASDFSLGTVSFGSSATLGFAGNALNGTPTPSDGTQAGTLALLGQYSTAGFGASGTSQSGTHGPDPLPNQPQFLAAHA